MGLIVATVIVGYIITALFTMRRLIVMILDDPAYGDKSYEDRREDFALDGGNVAITIFGGALWPLSLLIFLAYQLIYMPLWAKPTPGEKRINQEREAKAQSERERDEHRKA
jgi:hypothetical protein